MLEGIFRVGKQERFIDELCLLQIDQPTLQSVDIGIGNIAQEHEREVLADDRRGLQQPLVLRPKSIDACGQHRLYCHWQSNGGQRRHQPVVAALADERATFDQGADTLFQEERILPSVRSIRRCFKARSEASSPIRSCSHSAAPCGCSGSMRMCV